MNRNLLLNILVVVLAPTLSFAELSVGKLSDAQSANAANYEDGAKAFTQAIAFSLLQSEARVKLPGWGKFSLEGGLQALSVDAYHLSPFTDSNHSPTSFESIFARVNVGLPLGFEAFAGLTQVVTEHPFNGVNLGLAYQVLDFSTWIHTRVVPASTITTTLTRTLAGPSEYGFTGQINAGAYDRESLAQFAYAFRFNYSILTTTTSSIGKEFAQHGFIAHLPITQNCFLRTEVFFPTVMGSVSTGYHF